MFFSLRGLSRFSFGFSIAAYAAGILLAGTVTALGSYRVITTLLAELTPAQRPNTLIAGANGRQRHASLAMEPSPLLPGRQAFMTPLHAGLGGLPKSAASLPRVAMLAVFGTSSRYSGRSSRRDRNDEDEDDDDDEARQRPREAGTYRTMCVRLCDGYYFPVSFSATRDRFARDAKTCESSCGEQARLFVYRNPGAEIEDMVDLRGQPYRQLSTAFLYRKEYVAACRCNSNPWDTEARERHRVYALTAAKRKGDKRAAVELDALMTKMKRDGPARSGQDVIPAEDPAAPAKAGKVGTSDPRRRLDQADDKTGRMALGARPPRESRERPARGGSARDSRLDGSRARPGFLRLGQHRRGGLVTIQRKLANQ